MHKEILNPNQLNLLPLLSDFKRSFYLVGGTAIALQIGHRQSIDFDLFKISPLNHKAILDKIAKRKLNPTVTRKVSEQLNLLVNDVKFTFFQYPFNISPTIVMQPYLRMPDLLELAAMKAYALGRRSKWKDYVDLYFILSKYHTINQISQKAKHIFADLFSEKLFRAQLMYFNDVDYAEPIMYTSEDVKKEVIKNTLTEIALDLKF